MTEENLNKDETRREIKIFLGIITIISAIGIGGYSLNKNYKENNFTRVVSEEGNYELEGFISYDNLSSYKVVEIETITGERKMYIAKRRKTYRYHKEINNYYDIYSNELIGIDTSIVEKDTVISSTNVSDFLIAYDMIKAKYSEDDIDYLLNRIKDDYENNENLKLVKKK